MYRVLKEVTALESEDEFNLEAFTNLIVKYPLMVMPAVELQDTLRKKILDTRFWTEQSLKRLAKSGDKFLRVGEYIRLVRLIFL